MAGIAMERATQALLQADLALAEQVIGDHENIIAASARAEEAAFVLLALQAPVAGDLRAIVGSIQIVADVERMGALALHVAKIARRRHPRHALPEEVNGYFAEMGRIAVELGNSAREVLLSRDPDQARLIREEDDAMDDLHRHLFSVMMDREWKHGVAAAGSATRGAHLGTPAPRRAAPSAGRGVQSLNIAHRLREDIMAYTQVHQTPPSLSVSPFT
jgi:phosphate transport system protein